MEVLTIRKIGIIIKLKSVGGSSAINIKHLSRADSSIKGTHRFIGPISVLNLVQLMYKISAVLIRRRFNNSNFNFWP